MLPTGRSKQTLSIERLLKDGTQSITSIAALCGVTRQRVQHINKRMLYEGATCMQPVAGVASSAPAVELHSMKALTIRFTPAIYDALVEACTIANRQDLEEQITISDYVEQLTINNLVEMGLVRRKVRQ